MVAMDAMLFWALPFIFKRMTKGLSLLYLRFFGGLSSDKNPHFISAQGTRKGHLCKYFHAWVEVLALEMNQE